MDKYGPEMWEPNERLLNFFGFLTQLVFHPVRFALQISFPLFGVKITEIVLCKNWTFIS